MMFSITTRRRFLQAGSASLLAATASPVLRAAGSFGDAFSGMAPLPVVATQRCSFTATHAYPPSLEELIRHLDPRTDIFPTEVDVAELDEILVGWSDALCTNNRPADRIGSFLSEELHASPFTPISTNPLRTAPPVQIDQLAFGSPVLTSPFAFRNGLSHALSLFARIDVAEFEIFGLRTIAEENRTRSVESEILYRLVGTESDGTRRQHEGTWTITWTRQSSGWKAVRWVMGMETRGTLAGPGFVDETAARLGSNLQAMEQLNAGIDHWRTVLDAAVGVDVYGNHGIAAGDIDGSGHDSFYVCQPSGLPNRLFKNKGDGTFEDVTEPSGTGLLDGTASAIFADFENRGMQDLLVIRSGGPLLFRNEGGGRFKLNPKAFRFVQQPQGTFTSAAVADYDRDGKLDIYLCVYSYYQGLNQYQFPTPYYDAQNGPPNFLFRNLGDGTFQDVTVSSGMNAGNNRFSFAAEWVDLHGKGFPDLYVANDFGRKNLYRNRGDGTFQDVAAEAGVEDYGPGMSVCAVDADGDSALDLYVANMWLAEGKRITEQKEFLPDVPEPIRALYRKHNAGNSLYRNQRDGHFESVGEQAGVTRGGWSWSCAAWDVLHGGSHDLYVANGFVTGSKRPDLQSFFWRQVAQRSFGKAAVPGEYEMAWNAVNELVRSDYSWSGSQRNVLFLNTGRGTFTNVAGLLQLDLIDDSRAYALADIDGDGRLEILLKNRTGPQLRILRNHVQELGQSVSFCLRGTRSNRDGIGALLTVEVDGKRQTRQLSAGSGFASQHTKEVFFGVGHHAVEVSVTVRWPSGSVEQWKNIRPGTRTVLEEGNANAQSLSFCVAEVHALTPQPVERDRAIATVVSTWLVAPLAGPAFHLRSATDGAATDLPSFTNGCRVLALVDFQCSASSSWLRELIGARGSLLQAGMKLIVIGAGTLDSVKAATLGNEPIEPVYVTDQHTLDAWSIQLRYLFDRRRDLSFPTVLLLDAGGSVVRIHQGPVSVQRLLQDAAQLKDASTSALQRALPYPGPYYGNPLRHDDFTFGVAFVQYGMLPEAQAAFERAVANRPDYAAAWFNLGTTYMNTQQYSNAERCLDKATTLDPQDADAWNNLGLVLGEQQRYDAALAAFQKAAMANPNAMLAVENMMRIYRYQGRPADAQQMLQTLLARSPEKPELHLAMGMTRLAQGDEDAGKAELMRAIELRPAYVDALNDLGTFYLKKGEYQQALAQFEQCRKVDPDYDRAVLNEALLYSRQGDTNKALSLLRQFLQAHPDNQDVQTMLRKLGS